MTERSVERQEFSPTLVTAEPGLANAEAMRRLYGLQSTIEAVSDGVATSGAPQQPGLDRAKFNEAQDNLVRLVSMVATGAFNAGFDAGRKAQAEADKRLYESLERDGQER